VEHLFSAGCPLVIIACNTASAKALRTIQQKDLPAIDSSRRVLGVIRPTAEAIGSMTKTRHVGILATQGAVNSQSYIMEIAKLHPDIKVTQEACPMWVPLVENGEFDGDGADYFVEKYIDSLLGRDSEIDLIILGCTHYPLLMPKIRAFVPEKITVLNQGPVVAESLESYLKRHPGMESRISRGGSRRYLTTETPEIFEHQGSCFMSRAFKAERIEFADRTGAEK
ncbi:MAG TPA: aspartate/glutamate racemase family protein, partial [Spirochaetota bacterium]|nr:aspartate/glutamate racemase family protein [Spirochaetota bacterium]